MMGPKHSIKSKNMTTKFYFSFSVLHNVQVEIIKHVYYVIITLLRVYYISTGANIIYCNICISES